MNNGFLVFVIVTGAFLSAIIASSKQRNAVGWALLGACFPLIAVIIISCLPARTPELEGTMP